MLESSMDREREALRHLLGVSAEKPKGDIERRRHVARQTGFSPDYLYQIAAGIRLKSGKVRNVGRDLREQLDLRFPGWLTLSEPVEAGAQAELPNLAAALSVVVDALAAVPESQRDELGQVLQLLARTGSPLYRQRLTELLGLSAPAQSTVEISAPQKAA